MSKTKGKRRRGGSSSSGRDRPGPSKRTKVRLFRRIVVGIAVLAASGVGLAAYKQHHELSHDLSAIGNGTPTVVQVHDPGCPKCQQLKRNVSAASKGFQDRVQFRVANIKTPSGRRLASRYQVPHVTLLLFDREGERVRTISGITGVETLRRVFANLADRDRTRGRG